MLVFSCGIITSAVVLATWIFLKPAPKDAGLAADKSSLLSVSNTEQADPETESLSPKASAKHDLQISLPPTREVQIGFWDAWKIPNVLKYTIVYLNCKGIIYALLFWLPLYLKNLGYGDVNFFWFLIYS